MISEMRGPGSRLIVEFYDVADPAILDSPEGLRDSLESVAAKMGDEVRALHVHEFEPYGVSAFLLTSRGYVAVHTWPEHSYATVNSVSFSERRWAEEAVEILIELLKPSAHNIVELRGRVGV